MISCFASAQKILHESQSLTERRDKSVRRLVLRCGQCVREIMRESVSNGFPALAIETGVSECLLLIYLNEQGKLSA